MGPLFPDIGTSTGLTAAPLGLLGALPLVLFAAVAPIAGTAVRRAGLDSVALVVAVAIFAGIALRSTVGMAGLWLGTVVIGAAAAVGNVLLPVLVRRDYPRRTALASGVGAMMISGFAGLGSGVTVVLADWTGAWQQALLVWAVLPALVGAFWAIRRVVDRAETSRVSGEQRARRSGMPLRSPTAWAVTGFMGLQSLCFYLIVNWLPSIEISRAVTPEQAGFHLLVFQLVSAPFGLVTSWFLHRSGRYFSTAITVSALTTVAALGLLLTDRWSMLWLLVAAPGSGGALAIALLMMANRAVSDAHAGALSVMANAGGYLVAACGTFAAGLFHQLWSSWTPALVLLVAAAVLQTLLCLPAMRGRPVGSTAQPDLRSVTL